jgi:molybdenum cofactor synthesis domain-containing protein
VVDNLKYSVGIIVVSDRAHSGERKDESIPIFKSILSRDRFSIEESIVIRDDRDLIAATLTSFINKEYHLIFTSGGTGCGPRDTTPEVTRQLLDKPTPGLDEAIRAYSQGKSPFAVFSRAVSGVANRSFIINLPGSPKAVSEILDFVLPLITHPLELIAGRVRDCQRELSNHD